LLHITDRFKAIAAGYASPVNVLCMRSCEKPAVAAVHCMQAATPELINSATTVPYVRQLAVQQPNKPESEHCWQLAAVVSWMCSCKYLLLLLLLLLLLCIAFQLLHHS
jgi:hypothetical protein